MSKAAAAKQWRAVRRRNLARAVDLQWSSLRSHLADSVNVRNRQHGNEEFHAKSVREYSETIYTLSVELHELTKVDFKEEFEARGEPV